MTEIKMYGGEMFAEFNFDIAEFEEKFNANYDYLYDNDDNVAGYYEALEMWDNFYKNHTDFIREFIIFRGDFLSSDREVVAFMFTVDDMLEI